MRERPPGRPRDTNADAAILRAALDVFIERGIEGASIEQIAKRAGVGKVTVYRRWSSKEELISQAIETERVETEDAAAIPSIADVVVEPRFRAMLAQVFGSSVSHPALLATYWEHYVVPRRQAARTLLEKARAQGKLADDVDLDVLIDMLVGAVVFRLLQPNPPDAEEMRGYLESVYRHAGLLP